MRIGMMTDLDKLHAGRTNKSISLHKEDFEKAWHVVFIITVGDLDFTNVGQQVVRSAGLPLTGTSHALSFLWSRRAKAFIHTLQLVHTHHPNLTVRLEKLRT